MRKLFVFIFLSAAVMILKAQPGKTIKQIEFTKESRGYEEAIRITTDSLNVWIDNRMSGKAPSKISRKLEAAEWTKLVQTIDGIQLKDIPSLSSPTMKRAVDAAKHSTLTINTVDDKSYQHGFDDEDPNQMLQPLLKAIREIVGPVTEKP